MLRPLFLVIFRVQDEEKMGRHDGYRIKGLSNNVCQVCES